MKTPPPENQFTKDTKKKRKTPENSDQKWREEDKGRKLWPQF